MSQKYIGIPKYLGMVRNVPYTDEIIIASRVIDTFWGYIYGCLHGIRASTILLGQSNDETLNDNSILREIWA